MLRPIYELIAASIVVLHNAAQAVVRSSDVAWFLSIVLLTVAVRLLLFPLFVKQIKTQRAMQQLQPKIKALQAKHKGDRETLNREMMQLYKENNANPLAGCLPLLLQMPIFISLFHVLRDFRPDAIVDGVARFETVRSGVSPDIVESAARAKVFGAPFASAFSGSNGEPELIRALGGSVPAVKTVAVLLIFAMSITTFISQKQLMAKSGPAEGAQATQQKVLLYVMPLMLALFGFTVPLGVLVYWTTTNLWSMGQQAYVIRRMPPVGAAAAGSNGSSRATSVTTARSVAPPAGTTEPNGRPLRPAGDGSSGTAAANGSSGTAAANGSSGTAAANGAGARPAQPAGVGARKPANNRPRKNRKGQRRGGRR